MDDDSIKYIKNMRIRYQPIILPDGEVIKKKSSGSVIDSRKKIHKFQIPEDLKGKTVLDIGSAEGFFLRECVFRGAEHVTGIELQQDRANACSMVNKIWQFQDKINVINGNYMELNGVWDIVLCLSVIHHGTTSRDTWAALTNKNHKADYNLLMDKFKKISSMTKSLMILEFPYTYKGTKTRRKDVNYNLICEILEKEGIFEKVEFIGISDKMYWHNKDRCVYHCYK